MPTNWTNIANAEVEILLKKYVPKMHLQKIVRYITELENNQKPNESAVTTAET